MRSTIWQADVHLAGCQQRSRPTSQHAPGDQLRQALAKRGQARLEVARDGHLLGRRQLPRCRLVLEADRVRLAPEGKVARLGEERGDERVAAEDGVVDQERADALQTATPALDELGICERS